MQSALHAQRAKQSRRGRRKAAGRQELIVWRTHKHFTRWPVPLNLWVPSYTYAHTSTSNFIGTNRSSWPDTMWFIERTIWSTCTWYRTETLLPHQTSSTVGMKSKRWGISNRKRHSHIPHKGYYVYIYIHIYYSVHVYRIHSAGYVGLHNVYTL